VIRPLQSLVLLALSSALFGCEAGNSSRSTTTAETRPAQRVAPASVENEEACGAAKHEGCGCGSEPAQDVAVGVGTDPATGRAMQVVGAKLAGASPVTVRELLSNPDAFAGKRVHLEGDVTAMCHHKRAWFAIQDPGDRSGQFVRILAAPAFLVPPQSIGKKARAEGTVEIIELPAATQQHLAREHDLGPTSAEPQKRVVLRATGAEII